MPEKVEIRDNRAKSRFEAALGEAVAVADYNLVEGGIVVSHTEVPPAFRGQGIAGKLYEAALASARKEGRRVIPVCPVFAAYLQRHPETHDIIDPSFRRSLGLPPAEA
jgi:predicted GNAT family acetyltransferase